MKHTSAAYTAHDTYVAACERLEVIGRSLCRRTPSFFFQAQREKRERLILSESYAVIFDRALIFPFFPSYQEIQMIKSCNRLIQSHKSEWKEAIHRSLTKSSYKVSAQPQGSILSCCWGDLELIKKIEKRRT